MLSKEPHQTATGPFPTLLAFWEKDGLTQKQLFALVDIEIATLSNTLARMERDGLITRKEHPSDARAATDLTRQWASPAAMDVAQSPASPMRPMARSGVEASKRFEASNVKADPVKSDVTSQVSR